MMGFFSSNKRDKDFDVETAAVIATPVVTATPVTYATASLPTPAEAVSNVKINTSTSNKTSTSNIPLGRHPTSISQCPHCLATNIMTRTSTYPSIETWLMCLFLLLVFWPICWVPLVYDAAKQTDHICTGCQKVVGCVKPLTDCCVEERGG
ncbi:hypothetical protein ACHAXH_002896 [Discostella pseudostelligera]